MPRLLSVPRDHNVHYSMNVKSTRWKCDDYLLFKREKEED